MAKLNDVDLTKIKDCVFNAKNYTEAAKMFNVTVETLKRFLKKHNLSYYDVKYPDQKELSDIQNNILIACMLGDGDLNKFGRFKFGQVSSKLEYVQHVHHVLKPFSKAIFKQEGKRKETITHSYRFVTNNSPHLKQWRQKWYPNNKKIIPFDIKINEYILAHWFVQDGHNHASRKCIELYTFCFTKEENEFLCNLINNAFNFHCKVNKNKCGNYLFFGARDYFNFINLVKPYITFDCFQYKVDTSKVKYNDLKKYSTMNIEKANQVRNLYKNNKINIGQLAEEYDLCEKSIRNIINNVTYHDPNYNRFFVSGSAKVSTQYNQSAFKLPKFYGSSQVEVIKAPQNEIKPS